MSSEGWPYWTSFLIFKTHWLSREGNEHIARWCPACQWPRPKTRRQQAMPKNIVFKWMRVSVSLKMIGLWKIKILFVLPMKNEFLQIARVLISTTPTSAATLWVARKVPKSSIEAPSCESVSSCGCDSASKNDLCRRGGMHLKQDKSN